MLFTLDYLILRRVNKLIFLKDCITHNRHSPNSYLYYIQILIQVTSSCNNYMQIITILSVTYKEGEWKQSIPKARVERESEPFPYSMNVCGDTFPCSMCFSLFYISMSVTYYMAHLITISALWEEGSGVSFFGRKGCMCWPPEGLWRKVVSSPQTIRTHFLLIRKPSWP